MLRLDEAGRWFAALRRGVMTLDEQSEYTAWRRDPANRAAMCQLEDIWERLELARPCVGAATIEDTLAADARRRFSHLAQVAAVVGAVVIGVGISYSTNTKAWSALDWSNL